MNVSYKINVDLNTQNAKQAMGELEKYITKKSNDFFINIDFKGNVDKLQKDLAKFRNAFPDLDKEFEININKQALQSVIDDIQKAGYIMQSDFNLDYVDKQFQTISEDFHKFKNQLGVVEDYEAVENLTKRLNVLKDVVYGLYSKGKVSLDTLGTYLNGDKTGKLQYLEELMLNENAKELWVPIDIKIAEDSSDEKILKKLKSIKEIESVIDTLGSKLKDTRVLTLDVIGADKVEEEFNIILDRVTKIVEGIDEISKKIKEASSGVKDLSLLQELTGWLTEFKTAISEAFDEGKIKNFSESLNSVFSILDKSITLKIDSSKIEDEINNIQEELINKFISQVYDINFRINSNINKELEKFKNKLDSLGEIPISLNINGTIPTQNIDKNNEVNEKIADLKKLLDFERKYRDAYDNEENLLVDRIASQGKLGAATEYRGIFTPEEYDELRKLLYKLNFINGFKEPTFISPDSGMIHDYAAINDKYAILGRGTNNYVDESLEDALYKKELIDQAANLGVNIARIILAEAVDESDEFKGFFEIQEVAPGENHRDVINDVANAPFYQIKKLIEDIEKIASTKDLMIEYGGDNIMYDPKKGFSFIDMALSSDDYHSQSNDYQIIIKSIIDTMERRFDNDSDKFKENYKEAQQAIEYEKNGTGFQILEIIKAINQCNDTLISILNKKNTDNFNNELEVENIPTVNSSRFKKYNDPSITEGDYIKPMFNDGTIFNIFKEKLKDIGLKLIDVLDSATGEIIGHRIARLEDSDQYVIDLNLDNIVGTEITQSEKYVANLELASAVILGCMEDLKECQDNIKDTIALQNDIEDILSKYPELRPFAETGGYENISYEQTLYDSPNSFYKQENWLKFLSTLPNAIPYLKSTGKYIQSDPNNAETDVSVHPKFNPEAFINEIEEEINTYGGTVAVPVTPIVINSEEFIDEVNNQLGQGDSGEIISGEIVVLNNLLETIGAISNAVLEKTQRFETEAETVGSVIPEEVAVLDELLGKLESINLLVENIANIFASFSGNKIDINISTDVQENIGSLLIEISKAVEELSKYTDIFKTLKSFKIGNDIGNNLSDFGNAFNLLANSLSSIPQDSLKFIQSLKDLSNSKDLQSLAQVLSASVKNVNNAKNALNGNGNSPTSPPKKKKNKVSNQQHDVVSTQRQTSNDVDVSHRRRSYTYTDDLGSVVKVDFNWNEQKQDFDEVRTEVTQYNKIIRQAVAATIDLQKARDNLDEENRKATPNQALLAQYTNDEALAQNKLTQATNRARQLARTTTDRINDSHYSSKFTMDYFRRKVAEESASGLSKQEERHLKKVDVIENRNQNNEEQQIHQNIRAAEEYDNLIRQMTEYYILLDKYNTSPTTITDEEISQYNRLSEAIDRATNSREEFLIYDGVDGEKSAKDKKDILNNNILLYTKNNLKKQVDDIAKSDNYSKQFIDNLEQIKTTIDKLSNADGFAQITEDIKKAKDSAKNFKIVDNKSIYKQISAISKTLYDSSGMSSELKDKFKKLRAAYESMLNSNAPRQALDDLDERLEQLNAELHEAGYYGKSLFTKVGEKFKDQTAQFITRYFSFQDWIRYGRSAIQAVTDLDTALTELKVVSGATSSQLKSISETSYDLANDLGSATTEVINSITSWRRLGKTVEESEILARQSAILATGGFMSVETSTTALTSSLQSFGFQVNETSKLVDQFIYLGNNYAITSEELATSLEKSSAALVAAGNSFEQAEALEVAGNTILQDSDTVANALKVLSMRLRGTSAKALEEAGEDTEGLIEDASKLYNTVKELTTTLNNKEGVSIIDEQTQAYKSTYEILLEISKVWDDLSDANQAALLETIAGKTRGAAAAAILQNGDVLKKAYNDAMYNSEGAGELALETSLDSIEKKIVKIQNTAKKLMQDLVSSDTVKGLLDVASGFLDFLEGIEDKGLVISGLLSTMLGFSKQFKLIEGFDGEGKGLGKTQFNPFLKSLFSKKEITYATLGGEYFDFEASEKNEIKNYLSGVAQSTDNMSDAAKKVAEAFENAKKNADDFEASCEDIDASSTLASIGMGLLNAAINFAVSWLISAGIKAISDYANATSRLADEAQSAGAELKEEAKSLQQYTDKIKTEHEVLKNAEVGTNDYANAKNNLIEIQSELIKKYGEEAGAIDLISNAIAGEEKSINRLNATFAKTSYQNKLEELKQEFGFWEKRRIRKTNTGDSDNYVEDYITDIFEDGLYETSIGGELYGYLQQHPELLGNVKIQRGANGQQRSALVGNIEEVLNLLKAVKAEQEDLFNADISANALYNTEQTLKKFQDLYDQYIFTQKVLPNNSDDYLELNQIYDKYIQAKTEEEEKAAIQSYKSIIDGLEASGTDKSIIDYFTSMFPDLQNALNRTEFKAKVTPEMGNTLASTGYTYEELEKIYDTKELGGELAPKQQQIYDFLKAQAQENGLDIGTILSTYVELGFINHAQDAKQTVAAVFDNIFDFGSDDNLTDLGKLSKQIDEIQNAYKTLHNAISEYNQEGAISIDTLQSVMELGDDYLDYLLDEEGALRMDEEALQNLAQARLQNMRIKAIENAIDAVGNIQNEADANLYLASTAYETAEALTVLTEAKIKDAQASLLQRIGEEKTADVIAKLRDNIKKINTLFSNVDIGSFGMGAVSSGKDGGSADKAQYKQLLDAEIKILDAQLEVGYLDFKTYLGKRKGLIEQYYAEGKIKASEYYAALGDMYRAQLAIYDRVISAVTKTIDKQIKVYQDQQSAIDKQIKALQDANEERQAAIDLQKKLYELERARSQRNKLVK